MDAAIPAAATAVMSARAAAAGEAGNAVKAAAENARTGGKETAATDAAENVRADESGTVTTDAAETGTMAVDAETSSRPDRFRLLQDHRDRRLRTAVVINCQSLRTAAVINCQNGVVSTDNPHSFSLLSFRFYPLVLFRENKKYTISGAPSMTG